MLFYIINKVYIKLNIVQDQLIIRRASLEDLKALQALSGNLFKFEEKIFAGLNLDWPQTPTGRHYFTQRIIDEQGLIFIAILDHKAVGYICGYLLNHTARTEPFIAEIENIYVDEEYRKQSIGDKLLQKFTARAKQLGAQRLKVGALAKNEAARNFYIKQGFGIQQIIYEKELTIA